MEKNYPQYLIDGGVILFCLTVVGLAFWLHFAVGLLVLALASVVVGIALTGH